MSAVSNTVIPTSDAASTTARTSSGATDTPNALHPRPAVETTRPDAPNRR
jgi:hypothetical protein